MRIKKATAIMLASLTTAILIHPEVRAGQSLQTFATTAKGQTMAAIVYAQNATAEQVIKNAQSRLEAILADNNITVLDRSKAEALRSAAPALEDPGSFVTAEWFVENAGKFEIKGILAIYLSAESTPGMADYFTATAHADIRFISDVDAQVTALTTTPMGAPGCPPSDGLTSDSAIINAIQRAIDNAAEKMGMQIMDPATPRAVKLDLEGPVTLPSAPELACTKTETKPLAAIAKLEKATWRVEEVTAAGVAPAGGLAALGGYIIDTDFHRQPQRFYGSRIHLLDLDAKREIMTLDCHPLGKKESSEKGDRKITGCTFLGSWRYLSAITGSTLFLWDTERGQLMTRIDLPSAAKSATLGLARVDQAHYLMVDDGRKSMVFKVIRKRD